MTAIDRLKSAGPEFEWSEVASADGAPCIEVAPESWHGLISTLRDLCGMETVVFLTAVDRSPAEPRFELNAQLLSITHGDRLRARCKLSGEDPCVRTVTDLFPGAAYAERECFDMFGVRFEGHEDLKRLLMPEGYGHFPLRKEFPHQGIEPDRLYRDWERGRRAERAEGAQR